MDKVTAKPENLARLVFFVRGEKVMLDADLAMLYGVDTGAPSTVPLSEISAGFPAILCSNSPMRNGKT